MGIVALSAGSFCAIRPALAQATTGYLYVTDYGRKNLDRYSYTFDYKSGTILSGFTAAGNATNAGTPDAAVLVAGNIKEGLQGTKNDLIIVQGDGSSIGRYTLDGYKIGDIVLSGFPAGKTTLQTVGSVAITADGKYMYAPDESAGYIYKINLSTGHIDNYVAFAGVHDVAIGSDGTLFAAAYRGAQQVLTFDANLQNQHVLVASISHATGISLTKDSNGNTNGFYINSQPSTSIQTNGPDSIDYFSLSGAGNNMAATLVPAQSTTSSQLKFSFGSSLAPDGSVYTGELGGVFGGNANYTGGIYKYNPNNGAVTLAIAGESTNGSGVLAGSYGYGGLEAAKYLQFNTNFITVQDAGYSGSGYYYPMPEPGTLALLAGMGFSGAGLLQHSRRRRRQVT